MSSCTNDCTSLCPNPCTTATLNPEDAISVSIQAILNLNQQGGSTADDIFEEARTVVIPERVITIEDVDAALAVGAQKGIFFRRIQTVGAEPTYMINSRMTSLNVQNRTYNRWPCQFDSFYRPKG